MVRACRTALSGHTTRVHDNVGLDKLSSNGESHKALELLVMRCLSSF
jgi:hypothetical protein